MRDGREMTAPLSEKAKFSVMISVLPHSFSLVWVPVTKNGMKGKGEDKLLHANTEIFFLNVVTSLVF